MPGVAAANRREPLLLAVSTLHWVRGIHLGCSLAEAMAEDMRLGWGAEDLGPGEAEVSRQGWEAGRDEGSGGQQLAVAACHGSVMAAALQDLYRQEQHLLLRRQGGGVRVLLRPGADDRTLLRALWQAAWLHQHDPVAGGGRWGRGAGGDTMQARRGAGAVAGAGEARVGSGVGVGSGSEVRGDGEQRELQLLGRSLDALRAPGGFTAFLEAAQARGWKVDNVAIRAGGVRVLALEGREREREMAVVVEAGRGRSG